MPCGTKGGVISQTTKGYPDIATQGSYIVLPLTNSELF
jgi:hypothetical protein